MLAKKEYLTGDKVTIADFAFYPWNGVVSRILGETEFAEEIKQYKNYARWHEALQNHPAVKKVMAIKDELNKSN